jgi:hypothetical protein
MERRIRPVPGSFDVSIALLDNSIPTNLFARLHIFCFFVPVSRPLAIVSAGFLSSSILTSAVLIHYHQDLETGSAGEAVSLFSLVKRFS